MSCMQRLAGILAGLLLLISASSSAHSQTKFGLGSWVNELGSTLIITSIDGKGQLTGTYTTNVGCDAGKPQPLTGWYYDSGKGGGAITFSVIWQGCGSVASWSGQYDDGTGKFQALWHLTIAAPPSWDGIYAGTDNFTPK